MSQISRKQAGLVCGFLLMLSVIVYVLFGGLFNVPEERERELLAMLADPSPQIRIGGATGLAGISSEQTRQALKGALGDSNAQVRLTSAWALWRLGDLDDATSALSKALGSSQDTVRQGAVRVLRKLEAVETAPLLIRALGDRSAPVRADAALGLVRINNEAGFAGLAAALRDVRPDHRVAAARALALVDDRRAVKLAREVSADADPVAAALATVVTDHWNDDDDASMAAVKTAMDQGPEPTRIVCDALVHLARSAPAKAIAKERCR